MMTILKLIHCYSDGQKIEDLWYLWSSVFVYIIKVLGIWKKNTER